jgi:hypothetical protein
LRPRFGAVAVALCFGAGGECEATGAFGVVGLVPLAAGVFCTARARACSSGVSESR